MQQIMGDLPKERLTPLQPPFTFTGIDFFGPFHVKRSRVTEKVYGCIFVCFNTRAIHVEDVSSLSTDAFIQAFRRFSAVRGSPKEVWSDNGTNFTGAERELRASIKEFNEDTIRHELHAKDAEWHVCPMPKWKFQPPAASHMSGVWERLIRSVRKCMKGLLGNTVLSLETLCTVFYEAASILNSRPPQPEQR
jgi:transposase InsO family protein